MADDKGATAGKSPADVAIEEQGGEIVPPEFGGPTQFNFETAKPVPVERAPESKDGRSVSVEERPIEVVVPPTGIEERPPSPEEIDLRIFLDAAVNRETNILHAVYIAVGNWMTLIARMCPLDSADIGNSQFSGGAHSPLDIAKPAIALELYRQIKEEMRTEERRLSRGLLRKLFGRLFAWIF